MFDILNCGPHNRFTVVAPSGETVIVHNCENIVQALCRDIMAEGMLRLKKAGYPLILTVHDEIVAEVPNGFGSLTEFNEILEQPPQWGKDIPIVWEGWEGDRYRK